LREGGTLLYNSSLIDIEPSRRDLRCIPVAANEMAEQEGSTRSANMIMLGLVAKIKPEIAALDSIEATLDEAVSVRHRNLNEINKRCLSRGFALDGR
jgi:2-oxoglutarate ferredoxin oxidoreductase subunit gamma